MGLYQLKEEDWNKKITDGDLGDISHSTCRKWKYLAPYLDVHTIIVEDIDHQRMDEEAKRFAFFDRWKQIKGEAATYGSLISALLQIEFREDAEWVCKLLQSHESLRTIDSACSKTNSEGYNYDATKMSVFVDQSMSIVNKFNARIILAVLNLCMWSAVPQV